MSLVIIHLTDIHIHIDESKNSFLKKAPLLVKACLSEIKSDDEVILVITGDIAFSGKNDEYVIAIDFIAMLRESIFRNFGIQLHLAFVPGNHDCDFDQPQTVRNMLISNINTKTTQKIDEEVVESISQVQKAYLEFENIYYDISGNHIQSSREIDTSLGKILVVMFNSAWMSILKENPGKIQIPNNMISQVKQEDYKLVISLMHHPINWLSPDNSIEFQDFIRQNIDLIFLGHEHHRDGYSMSNQEFEIQVFNGKELQNDESKEDSGFSIYSLSHQLDSIKCSQYLWDENIYRRILINSFAFNRNKSIVKRMILPNREWYTYLDDPGMIIRHFAKGDDVSLSDLYIWPDLEVLSPDMKNTKRIRNSVLEKILENETVLIIGEALSGKTSMAKMICKEQIAKKIYITLCAGEYIVPYSEDKIDTYLKQCFADQYDIDQYEQWRQMGKDRKIIIIDNFDKARLNAEKRNQLLKYLHDMFGKIIMFSNSEIEYALFSASANLKSLRILPISSSKRYELTSKWYNLNSDGTDNEDAILQKTNQAIQVIDKIMGGNRVFVPALPANIINVLQDIDGGSTSVMAGGQYRHLYESIIMRCLSSLPQNEEGDISINITIMTALSFRILMDRRNVFYNQDIFDLVNEINTTFKLTQDPIMILENMIKTRIIKKIESGKYRFYYSYIFYYFCGKYIAEHINDSEVKEMINHMSERLYNDTFGNIMIFICYFAGSVDIINQVLSNSDTIFKEYKPFDFRKYPSIMEEGARFIDEILSVGSVGGDCDVKRHHIESREFRDEIGIFDDDKRDEPNTISDDIDENSMVTGIGNAMKTIDVLGQIMRNYPTSVHGEEKVRIVNHMKDLTMRTLQAIVDMSVKNQEGLLDGFIKKVQEQDADSNSGEIRQRCITFLGILLSALAYSMVNRLAMALASTHLNGVNNEALNSMEDIAARLVYEDIKYNCLITPDIDNSIIFKKMLESKGNHFSVTILRFIVNRYMVFNPCGLSNRDKLCNEYKLKKSEVIAQKLMTE